MNVRKISEVMDAVIWAMPKGHLDFHEIDVDGRAIPLEDCKVIQRDWLPQTLPSVQELQSASNMNRSEFVLVGSDLMFSAVGSDGWTKVSVGTVFVKPDGRRPVYSVTPEQFAQHYEVVADRKVEDEYVTLTCVSKK